ncbi:MAG: peptidoglycan bridge formation glycyltransferase FemA/FemB family protein [Candidatus Falkowbacteria bacterium]|nr:MAG: peptidoglycan bridge formation glycyltransferase FemA/FemB family protein [Candidatus Falkowbacteria bacterium]
MEIIRLKDKNKWQDFLYRNPGISGLEFLASPQWAEAMEREGKVALVLAAVDDHKKINALFCLIKENLPAGFFYWYVPRGPIFEAGIEAEEAAKITAAVVSKLKADYPKSVFLKIEPAQNILQVKQLAQLSVSYKAASDIQPQKTLILDLKNSPENLLAAMHQKTRYNIRLAEKKGVRIISGSAADFSDFWRLMSLTGERDGFRIHGQKHYQNLLKTPSDFIQLFFAEYEGRKIATALICRFGSQATYLHGASDNEYRNVMAPYLLQWEIIKHTQTAGAEIYDFYGVNEKKWPGVTRFKLGFGGEIREYFGVFDIVLQAGVYKLYQGLKKIKRVLK